jgi:chromosome segregation protein
VLGETSAKALRGGEMADVIFNGTDKLKPLGMAEVTLTMTDCEETLKTEFNEVSITRRVFRDGKGEYRINGSLCRLRDIHELFMDTGIGRSAYSIMEQGKIDMLLSARPEDRRQVFEEAAGITKFKKEKKEALRKLEYTEANLLRVSDVLAEQERRMNSLKRQVSKARRYQALATDVKVLDTHFSHRRFLERSAESEELKNSLRAFGVQRAKLEESLPEAEAAVVDARDRAQHLEVELSELRQRLSGHENAAQAAESRIQFNEERCEELRGRIQTNNDEIQITEQKLAQQEFDFNASKSELDGVLQRIAEQELALQAKQEEVVGLVNQRREAARKLHDLREELKRVEASLASAHAKIESAHAQSASARERLRHLEEEEGVLGEELEDLRATDNGLANEIAEARERTLGLEEATQSADRAYQHARGDWDAARQRAVEIDRDVTARRSRVDILKQLLARGEGLREGTRKVLAGLDRPDHYRPLLRGMLGNQLRVKPSYEQAVEAALGANLEAILVSNADVAEEILQHLTETRNGEVTLVATDWIRPTGGRQLMTVPEGAECWAVDCVGVDDDMSPVVERLLDGVLVVSDRSRAMAMRAEAPEFTYVTLAGEILYPEGIIRGGSAGDGEGASLLKRQNEVADLEEDLVRLTGLLEQAERDCEARTAEVETLQETLEQAKDRHQRHQIEVSTLDGQHTLASREVNSLESKLENVRRERKDIHARDASASAERQRLEADLEQARIRKSDLETEMAQLNEHLAELERREGEQGEVLNEIRTSLAVERRAREAAEQQQQPMETRMMELQELNARRRAEIAQFEARIAAATSEDEDLRVNIVENREAAEILGRELEEAASRRTELTQKINDAEAVYSDLRHKLDNLNERRGREEVAAAKIDMRLEKLQEKVLERYQVDLTTFEPDIHELLRCIADQKKAARTRAKRRATITLADTEGEASAGEPPAVDSEGGEPDTVAEAVEDEMEALTDEEGPDWSFVEATVGELRLRLDAMGPVNLDAIQEFEELEERHLFLRNQHDDLVNSKEELLGVIERINVETTKRFAETFETVRGNFRNMFKELFGDKAKADLILLDDGDPLDCGIEVIAKPPGKKLQSISLLSGGERSMTAVALLFSIYMVKPSPFCVLDELDAPLDEANIGRFLNVLDSFIDQSQFIIVTHNKRTMNRADVMYGVTMEEYGVSKPVGMRLTDAESTKTTAKTAAQKAAERLDA